MHLASTKNYFWFLEELLEDLLSLELLLEELLLETAGLGLEDLKERTALLLIGLELLELEVL